MSSRDDDLHVSIRPYGEGDQWILEKTVGDPSQMIHLNGPENIEKIQKRHKLFLEMSKDQHAGCMFTILAGSENSPAGTVGYWESEWKGQKGWEMGWFILPQFQGRGITSAATRLVIDLLTNLQGHKLIFAFPSVDNLPSNAVCRKLGFRLKEDASYEYPTGSRLMLRVNVWMLTT